MGRGGCYLNKAIFTCCNLQLSTEMCWLAQILQPLADHGQTPMEIQLFTSQTPNPELLHPTLQGGHSELSLSLYDMTGELMKG